MLWAITTLWLEEIGQIEILQSFPTAKIIENSCRKILFDLQEV